LASGSEARRDNPFHSVAVSIGLGSARPTLTATELQGL